MRQSRIEDLGAELRRKWAAARVWAAHEVPYMASALLALEPIVVDQGEDPPGRRYDLRALPVDRRWHVYLDPEVLGALEVPAIGFWLIHQISHLLRHHAERSPVPARPDGLSGQKPDQVRWNAATDAEINDDLVATTATVPPEAVTPRRLDLPDAWTAEEYWDALGGASDRDTGRGIREAQGGIPRTDPLEHRDCGSGVDGSGRPWDTGDGGLGESGHKLVERDVARRIQEHQRRRGTVPAGWQRWADEVLQPSVSWQQVLRAAVRQGLADVAGRVDFTYRKPSRRSSVTADVVLPSLRQPLPRVALVIDTSGSMSDTMLSQALGEVEGILRGVGVGKTHLKVVCCDAQAFGAQKVLRAKDVSLLGGGGTDMGAGLAKAAGERPRPDLVVVLTDGFTPWPPKPPPGTKVIVGLMDPNGSVPEWARAVLVQPAGGSGASSPRAR